jgi:23S rRNA pseudouridine1911/1915/1917 synthase
MLNQVLFEDNHIIIVNKKAGDIVQADVYDDKTLRDEVKDYIKEKYEKPGNVFLGVVHRIDRPVTGAVIFARTSKAFARLNDMFRNRNLQKIYWAVVDQAPPKDEDYLVNYLRKDITKNKSFITTETNPDAVRAELSYKLLAASDRYFLLQVELFTGRHHQIRTQLASVGCRIKGDLKYGFPRSNPDASIHLHARSLKFRHPVSKEEVSIVAPTPNEPLWNFFAEMMSKKTP